MQSIKDSSQQDRRVYVGNLSYDVKWHHLKDFMRQGTSTAHATLKKEANWSQVARSSSQTYSCCRTECQRYLMMAGFDREKDGG
jgi:RNA recognition motif-containing protein